MRPPTVEAEAALNSAAEVDVDDAVAVNASERVRLYSWPVWFRYDRVSWFRHHSLGISAAG